MIGVHGTIRRLLALTATILVIGGAFYFLVRPWYLRWGATDDELGRALPGDEILGNAAGQETRAITINAPIERVWPWLAQIGQDRGGFYSFDLLENLAGCEMPTTDYLRPDKQAWQVGYRLWMYPGHKAGGIGFATLRTYVPGRALGFATFAPGTLPSSPEDGSWSFVLEPIDQRRTRLLVRGRGAAGRSVPWLAFDRVIFEPVHYVMERRMMIGLKQLAEGRDRGRVTNHVHVVLWTLTFAMFVGALVQVLRARRSVRAMLVVIASATAFQFLTLRQPSIVVGIFCTASLAMLMFWPWRSAIRYHSTQAIRGR